MKRHSVIIAAIAALALCSTAKANTITLPGTGTGSGYSLQVVSTTSGPVSGQYTYTYVVSPLAAGSQYDEVSIYFPTALAGVNTLTATANGGGTAGATSPIPSYDVNFRWSLEQGVANTVTFQSPLRPVLGSVGALDSTAYAETYGVWVPNVPDGGLTVALLGGALVGLQLFRRKLVS